MRWESYSVTTTLRNHNPSDDDVNITQKVKAATTFDINCWTILLLPETNAFPWPTIIGYDG